MSLFDGLRYDALSATVWFGCVILGAVFIEYTMPGVPRAYLYLFGAGIGGSAFQLTIGVMLLLSDREADE